MAMQMVIVAAPRPAVGARDGGSWHLTRRGRLVVRLGGLLLLATMAVVVVLLAGRPAQAGTGSSEVPVRYNLVLPGETLWSIASGLVPGEDPRDAIVELQRLNGLTGGTVAVGQRLALPTAG